MPLGFTAAARTQRTTRPNTQAPDVVAGGGGGGGTAPTAPSDVTVVPLATTLIGGGGAKHINGFPSDYVTWKSWGFGGHICAMGNPFLLGYGNNQAFKTSGGNVVTAAGDATSTYNYQNGYEGHAVAGVCGASCGPFVAKAADPTIKVYMSTAMWANSQPTTGIFGDPFDDTLWADVCVQIGNRAGGVRFLGGDGLWLNMEVGNWDATPAGHTAAATMNKYEQRGYEFGTAIFQKFPAGEVLIYNWNPEDSWNWDVIINNGVNPATTPWSNANSRRTQFIFGMMRAHTTLAATGFIRYQDAMFYRESTQISGASRTTQMQAQLYGLYAMLSHTLPGATRNWTFPRFYSEITSWAGQDSGSTPQPGSPNWENMQDDYKLWSSGGMRGEFILEQTPGANAQLGMWAPNNTYSFPTNRVTRLHASTTPGNHPNTTAPTLSATASGTGSTRSISGTAAHPYAIRWVRAYIYPSGTPEYATMTWNKGGGSYTAGFANSFMNYTLTLSGVGAGQYAIVQTESGMGHQHSTVVSLGGSAFRLYANTSLWNTVKTSPTFDADADATLTSLTYGINNGAFCHPFYTGVASDPTWTVTTTAGWGKPARTVTFKAPSNIAQASGSDAVLTIYDSTTGLLWDMYGVVTINAGAHTISPPLAVESDALNGPGFGDQNTFASAGTTAIGCPQASGTILASDVNAGTIPHGLFMAFDNANEGGLNTSGTTLVPPAVANDNGNSGPIPQGGLMLATGSEPAGLNAMEHQLWLACSTYGVYCCDRLSGHPQFYGDGSTIVNNAFTDAGMTAIGQKLRLVRTSW